MGYENFQNPVWMFVIVPCFALRIATVTLARNDKTKATKPYPRACQKALLCVRWQQVALLREGEWGQMTFRTS